MRRDKSGLAGQNGAGLTQNYSDAVKWYLNSAEQGHAKAQNSLGRMYAGGVGVAQNDLLAYMWFSLAAAQGEGQAAKGRDVLELKLPPAQLAEAQRLADAWRPKTKDAPGP